MLDAASTALRTLQALPFNADAIAEITRVSEPYLYPGGRQSVQPVEQPGPGLLEIGRALRNAESMIAAALGLNAVEVCISANIRHYQV